MVFFTRMENFTFMLILTKLLGVAVLIVMMIWLGQHRGGFAWNSDVKLQFNWHPALMTVGMIILYGNAILVYRALKHIKKYTAKLIHGSINIFGFIFTVIGLRAVFNSHNNSKPPIQNLYSLHAWIGIITVIIFACQWLVGFLFFLFPGATSTLRAQYLPIHVYVGVIGFVFASATALMGLLEKTILNFAEVKYDQLSSEGLMVNFLGLMILVYATMVTFLVVEPTYKRKPTTEDQNLLQAKEYSRLNQSNTNKTIRNSIKKGD